MFPRTSVCVTRKVVFFKHLSNGESGCEGLIRRGEGLRTHSIGCRFAGVKRIGNRTAYRRAIDFREALVAPLAHQIETEVVYIMTRKKGDPRTTLGEGLDHTDVD